ncbi:MAG: PBP1A family penicillin-binding protein [Proteobacteria bacterium]|nr:PBP1A family penicillin-binding protein [Pseudomonadota bacterium]
MKKKKTTVRKRKAAPKRRPAKKKSAKGGFLTRLARTVKRLTIASTLAAGIGVSLVGLALYRDAVEQVRNGTTGEVWALPGRVWSGPVQVWPGMALTPTELARDLSGAGYARDDQADEPGEYRVTNNAVMVYNAPDRGPGWTVPEGEVFVTFRDGKVSSTSPSDPATFPPTELASVRGADNESRRPRELEDFPQHLRDAVLAMEDAHFYEHPGISAFGIVRAILVNAIEGETVQGASTLTQQLAKNLFLSQERTLSRKSQEMLLAFALEQELGKDQILALYLNEIYWGQTAGVAICGADEAARAYFGKPADKLDLGESATLAGIISSPNGYSPLRHPERALERRNLALKRMVLEGFLDEDIAAAEVEKPLEVDPAIGPRRAPYVVDAAVDAVEASLGRGAVAERGLDIYTEINPALQRHAERMVALSMDKLDAAFPEAKGAQVALVAVRASDGAVVAMVGGRDYSGSQYNRALRAERQAGSTVKPLTLLAALDEDPALSPGTFLLDESITRTSDGTTWTPTNYDGQFVGEITIRDAIASSRNIPAVLLAEEVGMGDLQRMYQGLGLEGATRLPSAALGAFEATPLELAGAYTVFPGQGKVATPRLVRSATDADGSLLINDEPYVRREASARAAYMATSVMETVIAEGTGTRVTTFGGTGAVAGKTGTTDDFRDAWFVGVTPELSVAVWVGFDQGKSVELSGATAAIPTWARFVSGTGTTRGSFTVPGDVVEADTCVGGYEGLTCLECSPELYTKGEAPELGCAPPIVTDLMDLLPFGGPVSTEGDEALEELKEKRRKRRKKLFGF